MADLYNLLDNLNEDEPQIDPQILENDQEWSEGEEELVAPFLPTTTTTTSIHSKEQDNKQHEEEELPQLDHLPYTRLYKAMTQEYHAPELLPFDHDLWDETTNALLQAANTKDELVADTPTAAVVSSLLAVDLERLKFVLAQWLMIRLRKLEAYPLFYRKKLLESSLDDDDVEAWTSGQETEYLKDYGAMWEQHLRRTVLDHFPKEVWKQLDNIVDEPHLETYCMVRVLADEIFIQEQQTAGSILIVPYPMVKEYCRDGQVELLA